MRLAAIAIVVLAGALGLPASAADAGGPSFELVDPAGRTVHSTDFPGRWLLVYFGYTHCVDQCPTALGEIAQTLSELGPAAERIQPLFITLDPERDGGLDLGSYTASFSPRLLGLGGTPAQVAAAAAAFGVRYRKVPLADGDYVMDHSGSIYLVDPQGRVMTQFGHMSDPYMIETKLLELLAQRTLHADGDH